MKTGPDRMGGTERGLPWRKPWDTVVTGPIRLDSAKKEPTLSITLNKI